MYVHIYLTTKVLKARAVAKILTECLANKRHVSVPRQEKPAGKYTVRVPSAGSRKEVVG